MVQVRPIWVLEELGLPYTIVPVDFSPEFRQSEEWRKINPVGKVPAMTDGDLTIFESVAMMQYILDRYGDGRLQPALGTPCAISVLVCFHRVPSQVPPTRSGEMSIYRGAVITPSTYSGATLPRRHLLGHLVKW